MDKPKIGEPCNGCGICCKIQPCLNGAYVLGLVKTLGETIKGECPALLKKDDNSYRCGIVENPNKYIRKSKYPASVLSKNFAHLIGAGTGCDEIGEEENPEEEEKLHTIIEEMKNDKEWVRKSLISLKVIHGL